MIRDTIDVYVSCIDKQKVHLVFQLWFISFITVMADVAVTARGYEPWDIPTYVVVWFAVFVTMEGLATLGTTFFSFWIVGRELQQMALQVAEDEREPALWTTLPPAQGSSLHAPDASWKVPDRFWDDLPDDEGESHD